MERPRIAKTVLLDFKMNHSNQNCGISERTNTQVNGTKQSLEIDSCLIDYQRKYKGNSMKK